MAIYGNVLVNVYLEISDEEIENLGHQDANALTEEELKGIAVKIALEKLLEADQGQLYDKMNGTFSVSTEQVQILRA